MSSVSQPFILFHLNLSRGRVRIKSLGFVKVSFFSVVALNSIFLFKRFGCFFCFCEKKMEKEEKTGMPCPSFFSARLIGNEKLLLGSFCTAGCVFSKI